MSDEEERPTKIQRIERSIDKEVAADVQMQVSGIKFANMLEVMNFAKLMATSGPMVRPFFRENPGACLAVTLQAIKWNFDPFAVAQKAYVVKGRNGDENVAYESQLIRALIETRCPLHEDTLNHRYDGEGKNRTCTVWAKCKVKGAIKTLEWTSPEFEKIQPKNSPLWVVKSDLQLLYNTQRDWCRVHFPHVILGVNDYDDMVDSPIGPENARDVTPATGLASRLKGQSQDGWNPKAVHEVVHAIAGEINHPGHPEKHEHHSAVQVIPDGVSQVKEDVEWLSTNPPKDYGTYRQWVLHWTSSMADKDAIQQRWVLDRVHRAKCNLTYDEEKEIELNVVQDRIEKLLNEQAEG